MTAITIDSIRKSYGDKLVIDELSLSLAAGEFVTLLGPSGCGKTTTLRSIAGLEEIDSGSIRIGDRAVSDPRSGSHLPPHRRDVGMVFQSYAVWPHLDVFENVAFPLRRRAWRGDRLRDRVIATLRRVHLEDFAHRAVTELSGGQQQRVSLARALAGAPGVLLFDEPLSNLDAQLRVALRDEIHSVTRAEGATALYVTHDQSEAYALSDRIAILLAGRLEQIGRPSDIAERPRNLAIAEFLGVENVLDYRRLDDNTVQLPGSQHILHVAPGSVPGHPTGSLSIRARAVRVVDEFGDRANTLRGTVSSRTFLGDEALYRVRVGSSEFVVRSTERLDLAAGEAVGLQLPPDRLAVHADDSTRTPSEGLAGSDDPAPQKGTIQ